MASRPWKQSGRTDEAIRENRHAEGDWKDLGWRDGEDEQQQQQQQQQQHRQGRWQKDERGHEDAGQQERERSRSHSWVNGHRRKRRGTPPSKLGKRWWTEQDTDDPTSFVGHITDLLVKVQERGRLMGDRGSNMKKIGGKLGKALGHDASRHGRPPFVQINEKNGWLEFEVELYDPFNDPQSFQTAAVAFRECIVELQRQGEVDRFGVKSRHCFRPPKVQPTDWECPNPRCGNLCFKKKKECEICKTPRGSAPSIEEKLTRGLVSDVPDEKASRQTSRPPKQAPT
ncbi:unnamed protein product, partial [Polarella glacialis]